MIFPSCREDKDYNEGYVSKIDAEWLKGFDYALECIQNLIENNLDNFEDELTEVAEEGIEVPKDEVYSTREDLYEILDENKELLSSIIAHWHERERDEMITSMIDHMDDEEYEKNKADFLANNPDVKLYDTRSFDYIAKH